MKKFQFNNYGFYFLSVFIKIYNLEKKLKTIIINVKLFDIFSLGFSNFEQKFYKYSTVCLIKMPSILSRNLCFKVGSTGPGPVSGQKYKSKIRVPTYTCIG